MVRFIAVHYALLIGVALAAHAVGAIATRRVSFAGWLEEASFALSLGLGVLGSIIFLLGVAGVLYWWTVIALVLAAVVAQWRVVVASLRRSVAGVRAIRGSTGAIAAITAICVVPHALVALYPPSSWDETSYHLASAKIYAITHHVGMTPYLRYPVFPQLNQMLFTLALLLKDDILAHAIELLTLGVLAAAVLAAGVRYFSARAGWWAAALLAAHPVLVFVATVAYVDAAAAMFAFTAVYAWWNWCHGDRGGEVDAWMVVAATLTGFACATKYYALFFLVGLALATAVAGGARRWRHLGTFLVVALAVASPWYVRNAYYCGDPFFPMFPSVFGSGLWTADDVRGQLVDLQVQHGVGTSLGALVTLPWHLLVHPVRFGDEGSGLAPIGVVASAAAAAGAVVDRRIRMVVLWAAAYVVFWFYSAQIVRYLMPALPFVSLATAAALDRSVTAAARWRRRAAPAVHDGNDDVARQAKRRDARRETILTVCGVVLFLSWGTRYAVLRIIREGPIPVTTRARDVYLTARFASYPVYRMLNETHGADYKLYALFDENMAYFADGTFMGDWFGPARYWRLIPRFADPPSLARELYALGADYFLINRDRFAEHVRQPVDASPDAWSQIGFDTVSTTPSFILLKIRDGTRAPR